MTEHPHKIEYFVDGQRYETDQPTVSGAYIKQRIPNFNPSYALFLEGTGQDSDRLITDETTITWADIHGPKKFYTVPPATFG